ncbi:hypothetical protein C8J56DRAFT_328023 [Mycena floridula]|nr:hypothetical protein C8J56DRAFT_328023 [Mycena floridula]
MHFSTVITVFLVNAALTAAVPIFDGASLQHIEARREPATNAKPSADYQAAAKWCSEERKMTPKPGNIEWDHCIKEFLFNQALGGTSLSLPPVQPAEPKARKRRTGK